jgi:hypothetical protein
MFLRVDWAALAGSGLLLGNLATLLRGLREGLSKIVIRNNEKFHNTAGISFTKGVLTFDHRPEANIDQGLERAKGLQQALEAGL